MDEAELRALLDCESLEVIANNIDFRKRQKKLILFRDDKRGIVHYREYSPTLYVKYKGMVIEIEFLFDFEPGAEYISGNGVERILVDASVTDGVKRAYILHELVELELRRQVKRVKGESFFRYELPRDLIHEIATHVAEDYAKRKRLRSWIPSSKSDKV